MPVYRDGSRNRDLLFIENHVCGIDLLIKDGAARKTCRIGGKEQRANTDIVRMLRASIDEAFAVNSALAERFSEALAGKRQAMETFVTPVTDRPCHDWRYAIDAGRIEQKLGFSLEHGVASGLL